MNNIPKKLDDIKIYSSSDDWVQPYYTPYLISSEILRSLPWSFDDNDVQNIRRPKDYWFRKKVIDRGKVVAAELEVAKIQYNGEKIWFPNGGRHRTKWMMDVIGLDLVPVCLSNNSLADAIMSGFAQGINRTFYECPIKGLGMVEYLDIEVTKYKSILPFSEGD